MTDLRRAKQTIACWSCCLQDVDLGEPIIEGMLIGLLQPAAGPRHAADPSLSWVKFSAVEHYWLVNSHKGG